MPGPDPEVVRQARKLVFDHFHEHAEPPVLEDLMERFQLGRDEAFEILLALEGARHLRLVPGTQRILMAFPFSAITTPFRVTAGAKLYFANCAWDAVALHATLGQTVRIDSRCHHCGAALTFDLTDGQVSRSSVPNPLVYLALPAARWWEDIVVTCANHMVFFPSEEHLRSWRGSHPGSAGEALTVEQTHRLGLPIYRDKMQPDYTRPTKDQLVAHFASLGLTGDFWRL